MRFRNAGIAVGLVIGLSSGAASAATVTQTYKFSYGFADSSAPFSDISGSFKATFNPFIDRSLVVSDFQSNLPTTYMPTTFNLAAFGNFETISFGSNCSIASGCGASQSFDQYFASFNVDVNGLNPTSNGAGYSSAARPGETYFSSTDSVSTVSAVPLPSSAPLFGASLLGLAALGFVAKCKKESAATG